MSNAPRCGVCGGEPHPSHKYCPDKLLNIDGKIVRANSDDHRRYIKEIVDEAPPLSEDQRARLAELLRPVRIRRDPGE